MKKFLSLSKNSKNQKLAEKKETPKYCNQMKFKLKSHKLKSRFQKLI